MDRPSVIRKNTFELSLTPNCTHYEKEPSHFSWEVMRKALRRLPEGALNVDIAAVDRHANGQLRDHVVLRFISRSAPALELSFIQFQRESNRFTNVLKKLGATKSDRLFVLLAGLIPELYIAVLGALKNGTVVMSMFSAPPPGPEPIATRIKLGAGLVLVITDEK